MIDIYFTIILLTIFEICDNLVYIERGATIMEHLSNANGVINVHVDPKDKVEATNILKDLGLNMTTLINMTLKQVIKRKAIPFDVSLPVFNDELEDALKETVEIEKEYKSGKRKGYNNVSEMMRSILDED